MADTTHDVEVAVVGAGPYGMSATTYLKAAGRRVAVFGRPMEFWQNQMPKGMFLRSLWDASHIADPDRRWTLDAYRSEVNFPVSKPLPLQHFVDYGLWYQTNAVPDLNRQNVASLARNGRGFTIMLEDGQKLCAKRVVLATGIGLFASRPKEFEGLSSQLASHSSEHTDLSSFRGRRVVVIGGGQSALDAARLLHEADADVEVIAKEQTLRWVGLHSWLHHLGFLSWCLYSKRDVGPAGISRLVDMPNVFRRLPRSWQDRLSRRATRPAGSGWMKPKFETIRVTLGRRVAAAAEEGGRVQVSLDDGSRRLADHVLLGTGYRVDILRYSFLDAGLREELQTARGYPVLGRGMESSVEGLHFLGKPAAYSFGPLLGFISGAEFAAKELIRAVGRAH